ncbi:SIR2 family protein [Sneathiella sp.]|uniref:SIR2 family NAD-dependent protein deacylase n=1 Tax=Sneathiella sp. TaxID=1964365 RepID=UPI0035666947
MNTHDPRLLLDTLRNHLTQPEANVTFLFGAGTSCAVRVPVIADDTGQATPKMRSLIPNVAELTTVCVNEIRKLDLVDDLKKFGDAYDLIEKEIRPDNRDSNIEDILSCVRRKLSAVGVNDKLSGLNKAELSQLEKTIQSTIAKLVNPERSLYPDKLPHEEFVRWIARMPREQPVEIFTTNYDVLFETALEAERVPAFDGFVGCNRPFFCHESLIRPESAPAPGWTRLWKIHGSINWQLEKIAGRLRLIRTEPHNMGEMILPSQHKYDESRKQPYSALLDRFTKTLERDDSILIVCGYSFSDEHINAIIFDALEAKPRPNVIAIQYDDPTEGSALANRAARYLNLMVLGPTVSYLGGKRGTWKLGQLRNAKHIEEAFELDPLAEGEEQTGFGKLMLGDFAKFSAFLGALTGPK